VTSPTRILFVCMGNICRSPTAEGVFGHMVRAQGVAGQFEIDSAGTHDYHVGSPPDSRAQAHALAHGYDISGLRARQLQAQDFETFDLIVVMDDHNWKKANELCPLEERRRLKRLTAYCNRYKALNVPDPYYGGEAGFEYAMAIIEDGCRGLLDTLLSAP
jgi:protein-tyrosine phosphatase